MTHAPSSSSRIAFQFSPVLLYSIEAGLFFCEEDGFVLNTTAVKGVPDKLLRLYHGMMMQALHAQRYVTHRNGGFIGCCPPFGNKACPKELNCIMERTTSGGHTHTL